MEPKTVRTYPSRGEIVRAFDDIASDFAASRKRPWPETVEFETRLPPNARVLDLGCGNGRAVQFLRERGHRVTGLDGSRALLRIAAGAHDALVEGDAVSLPFRSGRFDAIHCVATLHHLPSERERGECVRESSRVLRPRGLLLLSVWALEREPFGGDEARGRDTRGDWWIPWHGSDGRVVPRFYHLFRASELARLVTAAGLEVIDARRMADNHVVFAHRE